MDVSAWIAAGIATAVVLLAVSLLVAVVTGTALASWGAFPVWVGILVCALVPVIGPLVLLIVATVRAVRAEHRPTWIERGRWTVRGTPFAGRRFRLGVLVVGLLALAALFVVPIARVHAAAALSTPVLLPVLPFGGLLLAATFTVALLVAAVAARRTTRLGAVGAAVVGGTWVSLSATVILLSAPLAGVLDVADHYVGNALAGTVLSLLRPYDVPGADIASEVRESVATRLDVGLWVALAGGALLLVWSLVEVLAAHRAALRERQRRRVTIAPSVPPTSTPALPPTDGWSF